MLKAEGGNKGFACREMRWGWAVPWDKSPLINAKCETVTTLVALPALPAVLALVAAGGKLSARSASRPTFRVVRLVRG